MEYSDTFTITFGGQVENHVGMEKIGQLEKEGFTVQELKETQKEFESQNCNCELINLSEDVSKKYENIKFEEAAILIIRKGTELFVNPDKLYQEQSELRWDKKAFQRGRVVNKHARYNLCYADFDQDPDYEDKKGRVISFDKLPFLTEIRNYLPCYLGEKAIELFAEGNYYYDVDKCYISLHGDAERRIVVAVRLGHSFPLEYQWFLKSNPIGERIKLKLNHGDIYIMSEKATGNDWKKKLKPTLRHGAGSEKFLKVKN